MKSDEIYRMIALIILCLIAFGLGIIVGISEGTINIRNQAIKQKHARFVDGKFQWNDAYTMGMEYLKTTQAPQWTGADNIIQRPKVEPEPELPKIVSPQPKRSPWPKLVPTPEPMEGRPPEYEQYTTPPLDVPDNPLLVPIQKKHESTSN